MKICISRLIYFLCLLIFVSISSSCSKKTGCPINEKTHVKTNKKGLLSSKGGKSNLFDKKTRRRIKKKKSK